MFEMPVFATGLWQGLILTLVAGGVGFMFKLIFKLFDILIGR